MKIIYSYRTHEKQIDYNMATFIHLNEAFAPWRHKAFTIWLFPKKKKKRNVFQPLTYETDEMVFIKKSAKGNSVATSF